MYQARETSLEKFKQRVLAEGGKEKKSFYVIPTPEGFEGYEIRVPSDTMIHQKNNHPDMTAIDNSRLRKALASLKAKNCVWVGSKGQYGDTFVGMVRVDGVSYGVSFSTSGEGVVHINTFFKDNPVAMQHWLEREKKEAEKKQQKKASKVREDDALSTGKAPSERLADTGIAPEERVNYP